MALETPPIPAVDIWGLLFERTDRPFPDDHILFRTPDAQTNYTIRDVHARSQSFGRALQSRWAWRKGHVLVVMAPNHIDVPIVTWGCHWAGGVVSPVNPGVSVDELQRQLQSSRAQGLVVHESALAIAQEAACRVHLPAERVVVLSDDSDSDSDSDSDTLDALLRSTPPSEARRVAIDPRADTAFLVYSSGTTGRPKGVMVSHRNVVAGVVLQSLVDGAHVHFARDRVLASLPIYHIYGLVCLVHLPVYLGTTTVFMSTFDIDRFCGLIQTHGITHAYVAPPIVLHLAKSPRVAGYSLRTVRMLTSGGAPLAPGLIAEVGARLGIAVRQAYGLSETTAVCHIQRWTTWQTAIGANGPPLPGVEAMFVRADGTQVGPQEEGELWVRGPTVFNGYQDERELTAASVTADGWFKTGDIGYEDAAGNLYITDRAKDMIKFKGWQIAPAEVEDVVLEHAAVEDAAVIGVHNDDLQSEVPLAYVVLKPGTPASEETAQDILRHVQERVVQYKQLRGGVVWIPQIPKSPSGKILKRALRDRLGSVDKEKVMGAVEYGRYRAKL
ncbi:putative phenylacetyl-CoA ligase [Aspergillus ambiguus]|uniref:acyl--CoA ligase n=1 Tax=Aspergillus ambiguus TaxID=176160 RepID=UPI003CCD7B34